MQKYYRQYKWSNIGAMLRNQRLSPEICPDPFDNRVVVITGATSGIGAAAARKFASRGAEIVCINRSEQKSKELCAALSRDYGAKCTYLLADFSNPADVRAAAKQLAAFEGSIDVLIHNVGIYNTQKILTPNQIDLVFQTNYLSTFILNYGIKEKMLRQNSGRILFVNSEAHRFAVWGLHLDDLAWNRHAYSGLSSYGAAKMAQLLSMIKLKEYFQGSGVTVNAMHPGNIKTNSGQNNGRVYKFFKKLLIDRSARPIEVAAEALYFLGVSDSVKQVSGKFFNLTTEEEPAPPALDAEAAEELWQLSLELSGLK